MKKRQGNFHKTDSSGESRSNRALAAACICSVTFMLLITVASMFYFKKQMEKTAEVLGGDEYETYDAHYVMIPSDTTSAFWKTVYESAREAGRENGAYVELLGSNLSTGYSKYERMQAAIFANVDGIILEADESQRTAQLIREADEKGIPVVTVLGDNSQSARKSFVGISSYNLGREYGKQVMKVADADVHNVLVLMNTNAADTSQNIVFSGIQETVEEERGGQDIIIQAAAVNSTGAFAVEESIRDIFMNMERLPDIMICLDELSTTCTYQAVVDYNKVGEINIIGYYDSDTILKAIERNVIHSTISIDTAEMGRFSVEALEEYRRTGHVSEYYSVDISLITAGNVGGYLGGGEDEAE